LVTTTTKFIDKKIEFCSKVIFIRSETCLNNRTLLWPTLVFAIKGVQFMHIYLQRFPTIEGGSHGRYLTIVGFTATCAISTYHHDSCEFKFGWGVLYTTLCDKVCQWLAADQWFSPGTLVSSTNKTNHHKITEILLKLELNTITPNPTLGLYLMFN
jgi:hypothetical protein